MPDDTVPASVLPNLGCLMALDVGDRRVGVAACDDLQLLASPMTVLVRRSRAEDFDQLGRLAAQRGAVGLVVGHPLDADGTAGAQAHRVARYARRLAAALDLPCVLWDEYGSTQEASRRLAQAGRRGRHPVDAEAAAVILQDYLDTRRRVTGSSTDRIH